VKKTEFHHVVSFYLKKFLCYLPIFLLIIIALNQIRLAKTSSLSPWWGGGFGMFSSTDSRGTRHIHAYAIRPGIRRELEIPSYLAELERKVLTFPSESNLKKLAFELADLPTPDEGPLEAIEIQIWATDFDNNTLEPSSILYRHIDVKFKSLKDI
jgi:hypothetical protein